MAYEYKKHYTLAVASDHKRLVQEVNLKISRGYSPYGNLAVDPINGYLYQPMMRVDWEVVEDADADAKASDKN